MNARCRSPWPGRGTRFCPLRSPISGVWCATQSLANESHPDITCYSQIRSDHQVENQRRGRYRRAKWRRIITLLGSNRRGNNRSESRKDKPYIRSISGGERPVLGSAKDWGKMTGRESVVGPAIGHDFETGARFFAALAFPGDREESARTDAELAWTASYLHAMNRVDGRDDPFDDERMDRLVAVSPRWTRIKLRTARRRLADRNETARAVRPWASELIGLGPTVRSTVSGNSRSDRLHYGFAAVTRRRPFVFKNESGDRPGPPCTVPSQSTKRWFNRVFPTTRWDWICGTSRCSGRSFNAERNWHRSSPPIVVSRSIPISSCT